jgi:hypothetical protein
LISLVQAETRTPALSRQRHSRPAPNARHPLVAEAIARFIVELTIAFVPERILPIVIQTDSKSGT